MISLCKAFESKVLPKNNLSHYLLAVGAHRGAPLKIVYFLTESPLLSYVTLARLENEILVT